MRPLFYIKPLCTWVNYNERTERVKALTHCYEHPSSRLAWLLGLHADKMWEFKNAAYTIIRNILIKDITVHWDLLHLLPLVHISCYSINTIPIRTMYDTCMYSSEISIINNDYKDLRSLVTAAYFTIMASCLSLN